MTERAVIAGGSGLVGNELLKVLTAADAPYGQVLSLGRRKLDRVAAKLVQEVVDFDQLKINESVSHAYCTLGTTIRKAGSREQFYKVDHDYVLSFAKAAIAQGASKVLVVTALGANPSSRIYYNRVKGEIEESLREVCGSKLHLFRPSLLLGERNEQRFAEQLGVKLTPLLKPLLIGPLRSSRPIEAATVARAMLRVARGEVRDMPPYESDKIEMIGKITP